ncbi:hypothetical protein LCGC14_1348640 [marine sediment metagenome]|uniref:Uncharacterized protein n=1 Tax=marine sediment metagenome TaxID=412755 RepID=A0A0F9NDU8_9ZZZZ
MTAVDQVEIRRVLVDIQKRVAGVCARATIENPVDLPKVVLEVCIGKSVLIEVESMTFVRVYYKGTDQSVKFDIQPNEQE